MNWLCNFKASLEVTKAQLRDERRRMAHQIVFLCPRVPYARWARSFIKSEICRRLDTKVVLEH